MQTLQKVQPGPHSQEILARPPPIEVLAAEGFAQDPQTASRLAHSPTVSLSQLLLDPHADTGQARSSAFQVQLQASATITPAVSASLGPTRLTDASSRRASLPVDLKSVVQPELQRTFTSGLQGSTARPKLLRTQTAPNCSCQETTHSFVQPQGLLHLAAKQCDPELKATVCKARPVLLLPVPVRQIESVGSSCNASVGTPVKMSGQPASSDFSYAQSRRLHDAKVKLLPRRFRAVDDQTAIPIEVHDKMMQLGGKARGAFGYGQHQLRFVETTGAPVLRQMA